MEQMEQRKAIAAELDGHAEAWRTVNDQPEVQAARDASLAAQRAANEAHSEFNRVFEKYAPRDYKLAKRLRAQNPGLILTGDDYPQVCRCAISGLPIFEGDKVFIAGEDNPSQTYILADVIQLTPAFMHLEPQIAKSEEIEEDEEDDMEHEGEEFAA